MKIFKKNPRKLDLYEMSLVRHHVTDVNDWWCASYDVTWLIWISPREILSFVCSSGAFDIMNHDSCTKLCMRLVWRYMQLDSLICKATMCHRLCWVIDTRHQTHRQNLNAFSWLSWDHPYEILCDVFDGMSYVMEFSVYVIGICQLYHVDRSISQVKDITTNSVKSLQQGRVKSVWITKMCQWIDIELRCSI